MLARDARSLTANAATLTAARLLPRLVHAVYFVLLARYLGPELYGLFAYAQSSYLTLLPLTSFGLSVLLARVAGPTPSAMPEALAQTLTFRIWIASVTALLFAGAAVLGEPDPLARTLLAIFSAALLGRALILWTEHVFVAYESARYALQCEAFFRPLESCLGAVVLMLGGSAVHCAILHAASCWLQAVTGLAIVHTRLGQLRLELTWGRARELLAYGWPYSLNIFCTGFLLTGPIVIYRALAPGEIEVGRLAVPLQAYALAAVLPGATAASALPLLARLGQHGDGADLRLTQRMIAFGCGFGAIVGLTGLALGPWLVERVLGARYAPAGVLLGPALLLVVPYAAGNALASLALVRGQAHTALIASGGGALLLAASSPLLVVRWNGAGMLAAAAVALTCWMCVLVTGGVGDVRSSLLRPLGWVSLALIAYFALAVVHVLPGLAAGLAMLWWSAPRFGIASREEMRGIGRWFRTGAERDPLDV